MVVFLDFKFVSQVSHWVHIGANYKENYSYGTFLICFIFIIHMPQCLLTMHMIIMVHYTYWDNSMGTRRTNYSTPHPQKKNFSQYTTVYRPTLIITMYTILLFIHYRIMVNYRIRYKVKNVFQIIFIQKKCHYYYYIYCTFLCKHGKT